MLPEPVRLALADGRVIFESAYDANWIVIRNRDAKPDTFDGLSTLNYRMPGGAWRSLSIQAATRPGTHYLRHPMNPNGTAMIKAGQYRGSHRQGLHGGKPALVQVSGNLVVLRDNDRDELWNPSFARDWTDASGCNHHNCEDPAYLAGCIGSPRAQLEAFLEEFSFLQTKRPQDTVSLTVVEA